MRVRQRRLVSRHGLIRLRYVSVLVAVLFGVLIGALLTPAEQEPADAQGEVTASVSLVAESEGQVEIKVETEEERLLGVVTRAAIRALPQRQAVPKRKHLNVGPGQTLSTVFQKAGVGASETYKLIDIMKEQFDPRDLKVGQNVYFTFKPLDAEGSEYTLSEVTIDKTPITYVSLARGDNGSFNVRSGEKPVRKNVHAQAAQIEISLYGSAHKAGIPASVIGDAIYIYSWDVDFQRDIRRGDRLKVMYETLQTEDGVRVPGGDILYAELTVNGQPISAYRYETADGNMDYYSQEGKSLRKALMMTPIDGARLSSGFGMRRHPVLGYNKMHKGVDFAAPTGTPIYAAGDGTIDYIGTKGGYGKFIRLRHNSSLKTAYAHMSRFAKGMGTGTRVKQGQTIGYVGKTGRTTGAHLHYEVLKNGAQVNPRTLDMPQGDVLKGTELANFKKHVADLDRRYASAINGNTRIADQNLNN